MIALIFVTTTECNLACKHCFRDTEGLAHLPFDIIEKAVSGAKKFGIEFIHLTGGEPFLYRDIERVFRLAHQEKTPLTFSSNGLLLAKRLALLEEYRNVIKSINISLESHVPQIYESIRGAGAFAKVLEAFEFCRKHRLAFSIFTCLNKLNTKNLSDIVRFARKQRAESIHFSTVLPCANSIQNDLILDAADRTKVFEELTRLAKIASLDFFKLFYVPVYIREPLCATKNIVMCPNQSLRYITVDVEGSVHFCCGLTVYDAAEVVMQRLRIISLAEVSFDEAVSRFQEAMHRFLAQRIQDYRIAPCADSLDFNSCFYCSKKMGIDNRVIT